MLVLLASVLAGPVLTEGLMRFLLFHPGELARRHGAHLRDAGLFADPWLEDEYWLLRAKLEAREAGRSEGAAPPYDEQLGWVSYRFEPGTYEHRDVQKLEGRCPILLYGASYADRLPSKYLESSRLREDYGLLNYGVGGSGIGQTLLLMRSTLDRHRDSNPIVVIGLVTDTDFDRAVLRFRTGPKARVSLKGGELVSDVPVPPGGSAAYLARHGDGIASYAWRYLLYSAGTPPTGWRARLAGHAEAVAAKRELIEAILLGMRVELEQRDLDYFFLLFSSQHSLPPNRVSAREAWIVSLLAEHGLPFVQSRDVMLKAAEGDPEKLRVYFHQEGAAKNHPTPRGNRLITRTIVKEVLRRTELGPQQDSR